jgi:hypothetical protein
MQSLLTARSVSARSLVCLLSVGWGVRWKALRDFTANLTSNDIVLMTDAKDVLYTASSATILEKYNRAMGGQRLVL